MAVIEDNDEFMREMVKALRADKMCVLCWPSRDVIRFGTLLGMLEPVEQLEMYELLREVFGDTWSKMAEDRALYKKLLEKVTKQ